MATRPPVGLPKLPRRGKIILSVVVALIVLLIIGSRVLSTYVDWLWFGEVGFRGVFDKIVLTRVVLFFALGLLVGGAFAVSVLVAYRTRPVFVPVSGADDPLARYRSVISQRVRLFGIGLPVLVGLIAGIAAQSDWQVVQLVMHSTPFGITDPEFHNDISFYAFKLPFYTWLIGWLFVTVVVSFFGALITHYLFGGIRLAGRGGQLAVPARVQLSVTAGLFVLIYAVSYFFERYELLSSTRNALFSGATYTDLNAVLPAKLILLCISVFCAIAFFAGAFLRNLQLPAIATVLLVLSSILVGTAWPLVLQQFSVKPNESAKEAPQIQRNIDATRQAFGIGSDRVKVEDYSGISNAGLSQIKADTSAVSTISNVRLLDPNLLAPTFIQRLPTDNVYGIPAKLDVDRYVVDDQLRDFIVAAREINTNNLAENQRSWINRHVVYTHGNGFVAAAANTIDQAPMTGTNTSTGQPQSTQGGYPVFTVSDLDSMKKAADTKVPLTIPIEQPRVYFGELSTDYAIVGAQREYDGQSRSAYEYTGTGGVPIGSLFKRLVFASYYGITGEDRNLLFSNEINDSSRIIYNRDPKTRVAKVAPWLTLDSDPYPTVVDGRIKWIVDGFTTLENYPYAQQTPFGEVTTDSLNNTPRQEENISYIRNSVKAVVDAYDGSVTLYEVDDQDPVLKAWEGVFPGTVQPKSSIPADLVKHFRYPEDLFKVQRDLITRYHVDSPQEFFSQQTFWDVPADPTIEGGTTEADAEKQPPYYVVAQAPGQATPTFQVTSALTGLRRQFLAAWVSVSCDPADYGQFKVLRLPPNASQVDGPIQVQNNFQGSFTADRTLLQNPKSTVRFGNLLTLPVAGGLLYVEPLYIQQNASNAFPQLARVLVAYGKRIGFATTLNGALDQVFGSGAGNVATQPDQGGTPTTTSPPSTSGGSTPPTTTAPGGTSAGDLQAAADDMTSAYNRFKQAEANKDYPGMTKALNELDAASKRYDAARAKGGTSTTTPPPTSTGGG